MRKILFIITVIAVLLGLFLIYILLTNLRKPLVNTVEEFPAPTVFQPRPTEPPPTSVPLIEDAALTEQIINRLPVSTDQFDIEYLSSTNTFAITIKEPPFEENAARARQWFLDNGFSSIDGLNIIYNSYPWIE